MKRHHFAAAGLCVLLLLAASDAAIGWRVYEPCPAGNCPTVRQAADVAPARPAAKAPAGLPVPTPAASAKAPAASEPFPGPTPNAPRVYYVWDNGVVWEVGAKQWWWRDKAGAWLHNP